MTKIKKWAGRDMNLTILMGVTLVILIWSGMAFGQSMYSMRNIQSMTFQIPEFGFLALAMMLSNMIGGIDLSIIANANTVAIMTAYVLNGQWSFGTEGAARVVLALIFAVLCSLLFGLFNGLLISKTSAPSLIATLGTMTLFQGIGMAVTGGASVGGIEEKFAQIGKSTILNLPVIFWLFILASVILGLVMSYSGFGRKLYLYGDNPVAARFSAIHNEGICIGTFLLTGLLAGLAGLIILSRVNSAKVGYGDSYLLQTLIVCVIGGIDPNGGRGKVWGVLIAVIMMQILSSAFTIMSLSPYTKKLIWGIMLVLVLGLNFIIKKYSGVRMLKASLNTNKEK